MRQKLCALLALLLLLGLLAGCSGSTAGFSVEYYSSEENEASYVLENGTLRFVLDGETSYFTLTDKRSGNVWSSVPEGAAEDESAYATAKNAMQSTLILTYTDRAGNDTIYDSYTYAIKNGSFRVSMEEETLRVDYMIGPYERIYRIPQVITDARMEQYLSKMSAEQQSVVRKYYLHYDLASMSESRKEKILPLIPQLEESPVYALSSVTGGALQDYQQEQLEEIFLAAGYTEEEREKDLPANADTGSSVLQYNVTMRYSLHADALRVEVPTELIGYPAEHPIKSLQVLPYFCAASEGDEGWILVPDGGGAQIFFNNGKTLQAPYYSNLYGWDESMARETRMQETSSSFPVFGIVKNGAYLMAVGCEGNAELSVEADVSGKGSAYNYVHPIYRIVHGEMTSISEKTNDSLWIFQNSHPTQNIALDFICGNSGSYVDMAQRYRACLLESEPALAPSEEASVPLVLDFVGAIDLTRASFGVPAQHTVAAADYGEVCAAVRQLSDGINLRLRYGGVFNGGLKQTALLDADIESVLGGSAAKEALISAVEERNGRIYLQGYAQEVFQEKLFDGFSANSDAIRNTVNEVVEQQFFAQDTQYAMQNEGSIYLLNQKASDRAVDVLRDAAQRWGAGGIAFADYGKILYSDFNRKSGVSRDESLRAQSDKLRSLREQGIPVLVSGGNDYSAVNADCVTDMDFRGGEYDILDTHIPFYQIALHGYVTYTGGALNLSENYQMALLKSVEYGAGLSYRFFETDYSELTNSPYTYNYRLFSANFSDWSEQLNELYQRMNRELGHTFRLTITDHRILADGLTVTEYSDGTQVYVNYGTQSAEAGGVTVPARDWLVKGGN